MVDELSSLRTGCGKAKTENCIVKTELEKLQEELEGLNAQARELEATIAANVAGILEA